MRTEVGLFGAAVVLMYVFKIVITDSRVAGLLALGAVLLCFALLGIFKRARKKKRPGG